MSSISQPGAQGSSIEWNDLKGRLLLISPEEVVKGMDTVNGPSDCVIGHMVVLDGPDAGEEYPDAHIFGRVMVGQLRRKIGEKVAGRLAQGQAQPGKNAPWILEEASADDIKLAESWLNRVSSADTPDEDNDPRPPWER